MGQLSTARAESSIPNKKYPYADRAGSRVLRESGRSQMVERQELRKEYMQRLSEAGYETMDVDSNGSVRVSSPGGRESVRVRIEDILSGNLPRKVKRWLAS